MKQAQYLAPPLAFVEQPVVVNDVHSQLNATSVRHIHVPDSLDSLRRSIVQCNSRSEAICVAGGRHAMGGQQFGTDAVLIDMNNLNNRLDFNSREGTITIEAGMQWPQLLQELHCLQKESSTPWAIVQKQTGADRMSIGGAVSANIHGRVLTRGPFAGDLEEITIIDCNGDVQVCNRRENAELFSLVIGGYGLFGIVYSITLRLCKRTGLRRLVEMTTVDDLNRQFDRLIDAGAAYGDFQFQIDHGSDDFLRYGILSSYMPVNDVDNSQPNKVLSAKQWRQLVMLAHTDKAAAFDKFSKHYLSTSGQTYWSDDFQLANYLDYYHHEIDGLAPAHPKGTEMITELFVPRQSLNQFMQDAASILRKTKADLIYGTVRLIRADKETFLAWAKQDYACVILNLHTVHRERELLRTAETFRQLIDSAIEYGGNFYLTYHRFARKDQIERGYPQFSSFLQRKLHYDSNELFQSSWYRHNKSLFAS